MITREQRERRKFCVFFFVFDDVSVKKYVCLIEHNNLDSNKTSRAHARELSCLSHKIRTFTAVDQKVCSKSDH